MSLDTNLAEVTHARMKKFYAGSKQITLLRAAYNDAQMFMELKSKIMEAKLGQYVQKGEGPTAEDLVAKGHEKQLRQEKLFSKELGSGFESLVNEDESSLHRPDLPVRQKRNSRSTSNKGPPAKRQNARISLAESMLSEVNAVSEAERRPFVLVFAEDHTARKCLACNKSLLKQGQKRGQQLHVRAFVQERPFMHPVTNTPTAAPANAYFHLKMECLSMMPKSGLPKFQYSLCQVDAKTEKKMSAPELAVVKERLKLLGVEMTES